MAPPSTSTSVPVTNAPRSLMAAAHLPERLRPNLHECMAHRAEHSLLIEGTNDLAVRLKKAGNGVYLLSNASTRVMGQLSHMPATPHLDGYVISGTERLMKPEPASTSQNGERPIARGEELRYRASGRAA